MLNQGTIATQGPIRDLKGPSGHVYELRVKGDRARLVETLKHAGMTCHEADEDIMRVFVPEQAGAHDLFAIAANEGVQVRHLRPSLPTLEDVFAEAVGEE